MKYKIKFRHTEKVHIEVEASSLELAESKAYDIADDRTFEENDGEWEVLEVNEQEPPKPEHKRTHRLYVKWPQDTRYSPVDWKSGAQVVNLIYATLFSNEEMEMVKADLGSRTDNEFQYKFKKVRM